MMLNSIDDLRDEWPADALGLDDAVTDGNGLTAYQRFWGREAENALVRMQLWIGDAAAGGTEDATLNKRVMFAEWELLAVAALKKLWSNKAGGEGKDVSLPSGFRLSFQSLTKEEYEAKVHWHTERAYALVQENLV